MKDIKTHLSPLVPLKISVRDLIKQSGIPWYVGLLHCIHVPKVPLLTLLVPGPSLYGRISEPVIYKDGPSTERIKIFKMDVDPF